MDMSTKTWYKETIDFDKAINRSETAKRHRQDVITTWRNTEVAQQGDGTLCVKMNNDVFSPTEYCWKKICAIHHMPFSTFTFLTTDDTENKESGMHITRGSVDYGQLRSIFHRQRQVIDRDKEMLFRTYDDNTMRAVLSNRYGIIDNGWFLRTLQNFFKTVGGDEPRLFKWRGNEDTIYGNLLLMDTIIEKDDDEFGGMLSLGNCEIGKRSLSQRPSIFRGICTNGCIFGKSYGEKFRKCHLGNIDYDELTRALVKNIENQLPIAKLGIEKFLAMKDMVIDPKISIKRLIATIAIDNNMSGGTRGQAFKIAEMYSTFESNNRNLFGLVNAITRTGQHYDNMDWVRFDEIGGNMINYNSADWDKLQQRSQLLPERKLEKVFPTVAA